MMKVWHTSILMMRGGPYTRVRDVHGHRPSSGLSTDSGLLAHQVPRYPVKLFFRLSEKFYAVMFTV